MIWQYKTKAGVFYIRPTRNGLFGVIFDGDCLDEYDHPAKAAYHLANGDTFFPSCGDPERLGISEDLDDWERIA